ncbi:Serpin-ZX [Apostasia shenzhenica]|uniref:Serpin-ZX n=1 Tax=Apostasia shenzhenica TaxID=1088818 RepID=A0A2I0BDP6_9ASPA|nr:Serpin-ZX [Apostasia shenzhenica]
MCIFLPQARDGLWSLTQQMASESNFLDYHIPYKKVKVGKFKLPKFKISFGFEASDILKSSGMISPFSSNAELTEMMDFGGGLYVSGIFHKFFLEVNEEGSEAAAATAAVFSTRGGFFPLESVDFVADHPFAFLIKEDTTRVVLFTGHVLNPLME